MGDKELDDYMKTVNPDFNSHIEKGTIEMSNEYYNLLEEKMARLIKENQELKSQLKGTTHCFDEEEHERLKKQLHEASLTIQEMAEQNIWCPSSWDKLEKLTTQQKEFIKYLEDEIKQINPKDLNIGELNLRLDDIKLTQYIIYREILQKYKEIIGD